MFHSLLRVATAGPTSAVLTASAETMSLSVPLVAALASSRCERARIAAARVTLEVYTLSSATATPSRATASRDEERAAISW